MSDSSEWVERVQREVRGVEFFYPKDERNPVPGQYVVSGPTSVIAESGISIEHAAMRFLSLRGDEGARRAAAELAAKNR